MKHTALTTRTLDRFERLVNVEQLDAKQAETAERLAYIANMGKATQEEADEHFDGLCKSYLNIDLKQIEAEQKEAAQSASERTEQRNEGNTDVATLGTERMPRVLHLVRRGMEFSRDREPDMSDSIGNYRVTTLGETILMKNGGKYFLSFGEGPRYRTRYENKRTGAPLKKPVIETLASHALHVTTEYTPETPGLSYADLDMQRTVASWLLPYDEESLLLVVNHFSRYHYDVIEYVETFETVQPIDRDWTPNTLIHEWAQKNRLQEVFDQFFTRRVKLYTGLYEYDSFRRRDNGDGTETVTVYLKRVNAADPRKGGY